MSTRLRLQATTPLWLLALAGFYACGTSSNMTLGDFGDGGGSSGASGGSGGSGTGSGTSSGSGSASGASSGSTSGSGSGAGTSSSGSGGPADGAAPLTSASVLQHHTNASRDGVYTDPLMTKAYAASLKLDTTFNPTINGNIYAQPLYVTPGPPGHAEAFVVATESDHVTVIDATSGATIWDKPFGTPVPTNNLPCGTINPLGITGTPIIDAMSRTIYFDAMDGSSGTPKHMIHAVSLDNMGAELAGWPVDVNAKVSGFTSSTQNERGALALVHGVLYVPYGGLNGDCGTYFGRVIGVNVSNPASVTGFSIGAIAASAGPLKAGIWGASGVASDGTSMFVTTGNTEYTNAMGMPPWSGGEAILRLSAGPVYTDSPADEFHISSWMMADNTDADLGGVGPIFFQMANGAGGVLHLLAALGKDGNLYIVDADSLGGFSGQRATLSVAAQGQGAAGSLKGAGAAFTTSTATYIAYRIHATGGGFCPAGQTGNLGVARIDLVGGTPSPKVAWCSVETGLGSPSVTTSGPGGQVIVWDANTHLFGYDGDSGMKIFDGTSSTMPSGLHHFNVPLGANGRIVVGTCLSGGNTNECPASGAGHLNVFKP
jgi:hypothetical protein